MSLKIFLKVDKRKLIILVSVFIIATILGTVSHEFGHYIFAKFRGINMQIHYGFTSYVFDENLRNKTLFDQYIITLGGPIQTILTGTVGFLLLYFSVKNSSQKFTVKQWIYVFLSLFWLRQTANFVLWISKGIFSGHWSVRADEIKIAIYHKLPLYTFIGITGITGLAISLVVIFKFIPVKDRFTFVLSGLIGGVAGYILWLEILGKLLLP